MPEIGLLNRRNWALVIQAPPSTIILPSSRSGCTGESVCSMGPPVPVYNHPGKLKGLISFPVIAGGCCWIVYLLDEWEGKEQGLIVGKGETADIVIRDDGFADQELSISVDGNSVTFNPFSTPAPVDSSTMGTMESTIKNYMDRRPNEHTPLGDDFGQGHHVKSALGKPWRFLLVELNEAYQRVADAMRQVPCD